MSRIYVYTRWTAEESQRFADTWNRSSSVGAVAERFSHPPREAGRIPRQVVRDLRARALAGGHIPTLAAEYGISTAHAYGIVRGTERADVV